MGLSIWQLAVVAILVILLFGRGKLSGLMTDLADGIKSFRQGIKDTPADEPATDKVLEQAPPSATAETTQAAGSRAE